MDPNRMNFEGLLNETRKVDVTKEDKKVNESDVLGKGPDKDPKMNGKDPDLSNVNEDHATDEEDMDLEAAGEDEDFSPAAEVGQDMMADEGNDKKNIEELISYNLLEALKKLSLEIKQELAESGATADEIINYLSTFLKGEDKKPESEEPEVPVKEEAPEED